MTSHDKKLIETAMLNLKLSPHASALSEKFGYQQPVLLFVTNRKLGSLI